MRVLVAGGGSGSWAIRGHQLGAAIGATVLEQPGPEDIRAADVVVLVKRAGRRLAAAVHAAGRPLVWDAVDCWRQPADHGCSPAAARALLAAELEAVRPTVAIGATEAMAAALGGPCLPHHIRPDLVPQPVREAIAVVAYEGNPAYLDAWRPLLEAACSARGWRFVVNPPTLAAADLVVALRGGPWDGWICREWKSGVKVSNAIGARRPIITQYTAAYRELRAPGSAIETWDHLEAAFEFWAPEAHRRAAAVECDTLAEPLSLAQVAGRYCAILEDACRRHR